MTEQNPSVGRAVHYVSHGSPIRADGSQAFTSRCRAATVTEVGQWIAVSIKQPPSFDRSEGRPIREVEEWFFDDALAMKVENPTGLFFNTGVRYDPAMQDGTPVGSDPDLCDCRAHGAGTWHWPARI